MSQTSHKEDSTGGRPAAAPGQEPTRTCAGCRQRAPRHALLRLRAVGEPPTLLPDVRRREGGRGVSVHARRSCLEQAARRGAFRRALRREVSADVDQIAEAARFQFARRIEGLLLGAHRARRLLLGAEASRAGLERGKLALLLVAADAAPSREELMRSAARLGGSCLVYGTKEDLGKLFGRSELAVIAVLDAAIGRELSRAAQGASELAEAS